MDFCRVLSLYKVRIRAPEATSTRTTFVVPHSPQMFRSSSRKCARTFRRAADAMWSTTSSSSTGACGGTPPGMRDAASSTGVGGFAAPAPVPLVVGIGEDATNGGAAAERRLELQSGAHASGRFKGVTFADVIGCTAPGGFTVGRPAHCTTDTLSSAGPARRLFAANAHTTRRDQAYFLHRGQHDCGVCVSKEPSPR